VDHHTVETKIAELDEVWRICQKDTKNPSLEPLQRKVSEILRGKDVMQEHMAREAKRKKSASCRHRRNASQEHMNALWRTPVFLSKLAEQERKRKWQARARNERATTCQRQPPGYVIK
jgi:hypothetical protein